MIAYGRSCTHTHTHTHTHVPLGLMMPVCAAEGEVESHLEFAHPDGGGQYDLAFVSLIDCTLTKRKNESIASSIHSLTHYADSLSQAGQANS